MNPLPSSCNYLSCSYLEDPAQLEGALSQALAAGVHVADLDLSSCGLEVLPPWLARPELAPLRRLTARHNRLGRLDAVLLGQLPHLQELDLEGNQISDLGEGELPRLQALRHLSLSSNGLAALPDSLARCRALEVLCASNNPLTQLPEGLGACPALTHFDVSSCRLAALPASMAQSRTLQRFFCQVRTRWQY